MAAKKPVKGAGPMMGNARKQYVAGYKAGASGASKTVKEGKGANSYRKGQARGYADYKGAEGPKKSSPRKGR